MRIRALLAALLLGLACGVTLAHGNKVHVKGTIERVGAESLQVKTQDGKTVEVKLAASTVYLRHTSERASHEQVGVRKVGDGDRPAKLNELAIGDLVVIHATPKGNTLEADEVKFSEPAKPKS